MAAFSLTRQLYYLVLCEGMWDSAKMGQAYVSDRIIVMDIRTFCKKISASFAPQILPYQCCSGMFRMCKIYKYYPQFNTVTFPYILVRYMYISATASKVSISCHATCVLYMHYLTMLFLIDTLIGTDCFSRNLFFNRLYFLLIGYDKNQFSKWSVNQV